MHAVELAAVTVLVVKDFPRCLTLFRFKDVLDDEIRCSYS